jgi:signal transduction histidine kinase
LVAGIAHELNTPIGNGLMAISTLRDELLTFRQDMAAKGLQRKTFDNFLITIDTASDITNRSLSRSAELVRSFKQLSIDQATDARRRFSVKSRSLESCSCSSPP